MHLDGQTYKIINFQQKIKQKIKQLKIKIKIKQLKLNKQNYYYYYCVLLLLFEKLKTLLQQIL